MFTVVLCSLLSCGVVVCSLLCCGVVLCSLLCYKLYCVHIVVLCCCAVECRTVNRGDGGSIPPTTVSKLRQLCIFRKTL